MRFTETLRPAGHLTLLVRRHGRPLLCDPHPNLILDAGRAAMAALWAGTGSGRPTRIMVGTGTASPAAGDSRLTDPVTRALSAAAGPGTKLPEPWASLPGLLQPGPATARFCFEIPEEAANGLALADEAGHLLARWTRAAILKEPDLSLLGVWDITF